ncbi:hypothetical protein JCM11641_007164 [Rhodosporidiobolus odoratus]
MPSLVSLPFELLIYICELVQTAQTRPYLGHVCTTLLQPARQVTFRSVTVDAWHSLDLPDLHDLIALVKTTPTIGTVIRELQLGPMLIHPHDHGVPRPGTLGHFLEAMPNLSDLDLYFVDEGEALVDVVFEESIPNPDLEAYQPFHGSKLKGQSWYLSLTGDLSNPAVSDLISLFQRVDTLILNDSSPQFASPLPSCLEAVARPSSLTALSLSSVSIVPHGADLTSCDLSSFTNLSSLEFGPNTFDLSLLPSLRNLPDLTRLVFGKNTSVPIIELKALLRGPTSLPLLCMLRLDIVYEQSSLLVAGWTESFTREGVIELLDLAEEEGVKLSGLAVGLAIQARRCRS